MSGKNYDGFFIGWSKKLPKGLRSFLIVFYLFLVGAFAGTAYSFVTLQRIRVLVDFRDG